MREVKPKLKMSSTRFVFRRHDLAQSFRFAKSHFRYVTPLRVRKDHQKYQGTILLTVLLHARLRAAAMEENMRTAAMKENMLSREYAC